MPVTYPASYADETEDYRIDGLLGGFKWGEDVGTGVSLTYSFHTPGVSTYGIDQEDYGDAAPFNNPAALSEASKAAVRAALGEWSKVANVTFTEVADTGTSDGVLRFGASDSVGTADGVFAGYAFYPNNYWTIGGDVWFSRNFSGFSSVPPGKAAFSIIVHEIGHALGLKHSFEGGTVIPKAEDTARFTTMSYTSEEKWGGYENSTPMLYDIKAVQYLYGANTKTATGNDIYQFDPGALNFKTIWDAGGVDTIDAHLFHNPVTVNLAAGSFSTIADDFATPVETPSGLLQQARNNIAIADGVTIENARGGAGNDILTGNAANNRLQGGVGDDTLDGGAGRDLVSYTDSVGAVTVDLRKGAADGAGTGHDTLIAIEQAEGSGADDFFIGDDAANSFFGEGGIDTVTWGGLRREFGVTIDAVGDDRVSGREGDDILRSIEHFVFTDGEFVTDVHDEAAQIFRLYGATLGRSPDPGGLKGWTNALDSGALTLTQAAEGFTGSVEFQQKYGSLDNPGFVDLLYQNVLGREPDGPGLQNWINALGAGMSRPEVVLNFSESAENVELTRADIEGGVWLRDNQAASVARLYDTVLDRLPDAGGVANWTNALKAGMTLQQVADGFTGSAEFQQKYGSLDDGGFVDLLYRNVLDRNPDAAGKASWTNALDAGMSRSEVVLEFSESQEHQIMLAGVIDDGVWYA